MQFELQAVVVVVQNASVLRNTDWHLILVLAW